MKANFRVFVLVLFVGTLVIHKTAWSQSINLGQVDTKSIAAFNPTTKTVYRVWRDSIRAFLAPDYNKSALSAIKNPPDLEFPLGYKPVFIDNSMVFVSWSGGLVYRLDSDSLIREDRSFKHQMQIMSSVFTRNDTIFKYGGYGFWSARNFFTYFSFDSHEWEILAPYGSKEVPAGSHSGEITVKDSLLYVFSGHAVNRANPLKTDLPVKDVWSFNINLHKWNFLGTMEKALYAVYPGPAARNPGIKMGDRILTKIDKKFSLINPSKNLVSYYEIDQKYFRMLMFVDPAFSSFYADGFFYILTYKSTHGQIKTDLTLEVVPENELLKFKLDEMPLYEENSFPWKPVLAVLLSIATLSFVWTQSIKSKRNQLITVFNNSVVFKRKSIELEPNAIKVLKAIVQSRGELSSQEVLLLCENPNLSEAHNLKIKNQLIDSINLRLKTLVGETEDFITSSKSTEDRRVKSYKVDYKRFKVRG